MKIIGVVILLLGVAVSSGCGSRSLASGVVKQPVQTGYAPVNGLQIYFEIHGIANPARPPLVLLHGGNQWGLPSNLQMTSVSETRSITC